MGKQSERILFVLLRAALLEQSRSELSELSLDDRLLGELYEISVKHDIAHIVGTALIENSLLPQDSGFEKAFKAAILKAKYRHGRIEYEYKQVCSALEAAGTAFMPLKGAVIGKYYKRPWMRTSADIDILVRPAELEASVVYLTESCGYSLLYRTPHDVSLSRDGGIHVELHFELSEHTLDDSFAQAKEAEVLDEIWEHTTLCDGSGFKYEPTDEYLYFYHISHMMKHVKYGGCGIRPFIDLMLLDRLCPADTGRRDRLLVRGGLIKFAQAARRLSGVWFYGSPEDELSLQLGEFIMNGGAFGSADNRVAVAGGLKDGRASYIVSRLLLPYDRLKLYYPILEKHRWLTPIMQLRRWLTFFRPQVRGMAINELKASRSIENTEKERIKTLLKDLGIDRK